MKLKRVHFAGLDADYREHELDEMRALASAHSGRHELEVVHAFKAYLDAMIYDEQRWRGRRSE